MDLSTLFAILGFILAAYSVVGNDVIQTLGTFLTSNSNRPWYVLWGFAGAILSAVMIYGWFVNSGDMAYGRLEKFPYPDQIQWWYALPPLVLLVITRFGIPVSTTFLILSIFGSATVMSKVVLKSVSGYFIAFILGVVVYSLTSKALEKQFIDSEHSEDENHNLWVGAQWVSTGLLWTYWLIQDLANIYVYLPRQISIGHMLMSLAVLLALLAYIFYNRGGAIQGIVKSKTNTADIRSATIVDFLFAILLFVFKEWSNLPMSTTWVFIGLLAGREFAISYILKEPKLSIVTRMTLSDLGKTVAGLVVSVLLIILIKFLAGEPMAWT